MAVSGLEQRYAPMILTQPVWSPWGIGVLTPWLYDEDEATEKSKPKQKQVQRSRSWADHSTFVQNARYEQLFCQHPENKVVVCDAGTDQLKQRRTSDPQIRAASHPAAIETSRCMTSEASEGSTCAPSGISHLSFSDAADSAKTIAAIGKKQAHCQITKKPSTVDPASATTLTIRNLPWKLTREKLLQVVDSSGFEGLYDFVYLPHKLSEHRNLGFAFINFVNVEVAHEFQALWHNSRRFSVKGTYKGVKALNVSVAAVQGRDQNVHKASSNKMGRVKNTSFQPFVSDSLLSIND